MIISCLICDIFSVRTLPEAFGFHVICTETEPVYISCFAAGAKPGAEQVLEAVLA